ncbi:MAG TPA: M23 family metallopeptidase [Chloroflexota bacterium]|jgi:murein DD-endopeptidase MepM/ murein hydrolase activator NlpD|nr:M23 family metallopeptidase [Chloroflexota bacterium]
MRPPLNGTLRITQLFGGNPRLEAFVTGDGLHVLGHTGIDIACPIGTPVYPCWEGVVHIADSGTQGLGLHATITDARGRQAQYGHLSAVLVTDGAHVPLHVPFAHSGSTGNVTGPHLHFEIREPDPDPLNGYYGCRDPLGGFDHDVLSHIDLNLTNL